MAKNQVAALATRFRLGIASDMACQAAIYMWYLQDKTQNCFVITQNQSINVIFYRAPQQVNPAHLSMQIFSILLHKNTAHHD